MPALATRGESTMPMLAPEDGDRCEALLAMGKSHCHRPQLSPAQQKGYSDLWTTYSGGSPADGRGQQLSNKPRRSEKILNEYDNQETWPIGEIRDHLDEQFRRKRLTYHWKPPAYELCSSLAAKATRATPTSSTH